MRQSIIALAILVFAGFWTPSEAGTRQALSDLVVEGAPPIIRIAQLGQAKIYAPKRVDTDQESVDFTGKIEANGEIRVRTH